MPKSRRVTIKEIAEEAGVSMQTVSRVLNNRPDVASDTRRRIKKIIATHNYRPSSVARGITQGRSYILGVISAKLQYHGPAGMLMGIEQSANALGYTIILRVVRDPEQFDVDEHLNFFRSQHVDGIIWTLPEIGDLRASVIEKVPRLQIPNVFFNMQPHPDLTVLDFDQELGSRKAVDHLLEQGAQTVGLITGPMTWLAARTRYLGWQNALEVAGYKVDDNLVAQGDWSASSGEQAMRQLLSRCPDLDAVFVCNDHMAMGAMKAARLLNRRIPDQLMMVGYDNIPETDFLCPPLTTITTNFASISHFAVNKLDRMIAAAERDEEWTEPNIYLFEPELVVRESSIRKKRILK